LAALRASLSAPHHRIEGGDVVLDHAGQPVAKLLRLGQHRSHLVFDIAVFLLADGEIAHHCDERGTHGADDHVPRPIGRDLVTQMAASGLSANEIGSALISIMARSRGSTNRPDTLAQDQPRHLQKPLATHGRYAKAALREELRAKITDGNLLEGLLEDLDPILRGDAPNWEDEEHWSRYINRTNDPSPDELVPFLAGLACRDPKGVIAYNMARIADYDYEWVEDKRRYVKPLVKALLNENCEGAKALPERAREVLENLNSAAE
jgi:hypothetical protein